MVLFAFFGFGVWATLGIGAAAVSIPVIIHLINRKRYKIVPWAAMRFLLAAQKQTRKRMRIEQLLLLLTRMAIIALVLFAMASVMPWAEAYWASLPFLQKFGSGRGNGPRTHYLFVLDASLSMNQKVDNDQTAFDAARQALLRKLDDTRSGDGYSILVLKDNPAWIVGQASLDKSKVKKEIDNLKPSHGNASLPVAMNMITAKLNEPGNRFPVQAVYFFTDMQRSTWSSAAAAAGGGDAKGERDADAKEKRAYQEIQKKATTIFVDVGPQKDNANVAVLDMHFDADAARYVTAETDVPLVVTVHNFGPEKKVRAEVFIGKAKSAPGDAELQMRVYGLEEDDKKASQRTIQQQSSHTFRFNKIRFPTPGLYVVKVNIDDDALAADNSRAIVISVRETVPVLLVNGKPSPDRFERATEFLRLALNPFPNGGEPKWFPVRPKVVSALSDIPEAKLEEFDCIYFCDVDKFSQADMRKIDSHLRRGGGIVFTMGDRVADDKVMEHYNEVLYKHEQGILPARLIKRISAPLEHHFYLHNTDDEAFKEPPLAMFIEREDRLTLRNARFKQFILSAVPEGKAKMVLGFMPEAAKIKGIKRDDTLPLNAPALVEWNPVLPRAHQPLAQKGRDRQPSRYRGKVILLTTTVNMDWNSWPGSPSFGPMMHEITRLAVSGKLREQTNTVGGLLEEFLPGAAGVEMDVTVNFPEGHPETKPATVHTQLIDDVNLFRYPDRYPSAGTDYSGIYRVETAKKEIPFAVNVPTESSDPRDTESDLTRLDEAKLNELYPDWKIQVVRDPLMGLLTGANVDTGALSVSMPVGPDIANVALLIVLALCFAEILFAWHFGHYTTTDGTVAESAAKSLTATLIAASIAVVAGLAFIIGAIVITHANVTGDFLSFLPDYLREFLENARPAPGESINWKYDTSSFLFGLPRENWWMAGIALGAVVLIVLIYRAEAPKVSPVYKLLLGALRLFLILLVLCFLLPRPQLGRARMDHADLVLLIDDTRSMGEPDAFRDKDVQESVKKLGDSIRTKLEADLPGKIAALEAAITAKTAAAEKDADARADIDSLKQRLTYWQKQREVLNAGTWRPSRLQLAQAILSRPEPHWLKTLITSKKTKLHIFHLDVNGRAIKLNDDKGDAGELIDEDQVKIDRAVAAISNLEPVGNDSRLGTSVEQVIDHYRGSSLYGVVMFTDGVTTRDKTIAQIADYASQRSVSLWFVGIGDETDKRDLKLHNLSAEDEIYLGDRALFRVFISGHGFKDTILPIILKLVDKNGKEVELSREMTKIDPNGRPIEVRLYDTPKEAGERKYVIEVEQPKLEPNDKPIPRENLRLTHTMRVVQNKTINVLYVEGQPRYEFRYIKYLMEREMAPDDNDKGKGKGKEPEKKKSIDLTVLLLDGDEDWPAKDRKDGKGTDRSAIQNFPPTLEKLNQYDVLIIGDCDPQHKKLQNNLKMIRAYARGELEDGRNSPKPGGGVLFMGGVFHNPHQYKGTPLADIMPIEPLVDRGPPDFARTESYKPELTPGGRNHPIFHFTPDERENMNIMDSLMPMYWHSSKYSLKQGAEALAVHPTQKYEGPRNAGSPDKLPLVAQFYPSSGRSMFFGFDETWRWRKDDEKKFNDFWIQTMRFLSRGRRTNTTLKLDRQMPYRVGETIKVKVQFPESAPKKDGPKVDDKNPPKVTVEYYPPGGKGDPESQSLELAKEEKSFGTYEGQWVAGREGKYRFRLTTPDVSATQPDRKQPSAEAIVELPPGELEKLRLNYQELQQAADTAGGRYYTVAKADSLLDEIPEGPGVVISPNVPPTVLWNHWLVFIGVLLLITSEWILRKFKHLL